MITIALSKGRILKEELLLLKKAGYHLDDILKDERRLLFNFPQYEINVMLLKPFDVPIYVEKGSADLGMVGLDVIEEEKKDVLKLFELKMGICKIVVAKPKKTINNVNNPEKIKIGTKFPNITKEFYVKKGVDVEIIKLYGSIELAPIVGISDYIVDIVSSGETLRKNGLVEVEDVLKVSSYLIGNKVSFKTKFDKIKKIIDNIRKNVR
ncbi:MAG: ATP phosphoribosyltransferase [Proteobacteria bacterium]|nr:ATP phosphoribosyltransferase [Pseudomonadota bacterium]